MLQYLDASPEAVCQTSESLESLLREPDERFSKLAFDSSVVASLDGYLRFAGRPHDAQAWLPSADDDELARRVLLVLLRMADVPTQSVSFFTVPRLIDVVSIFGPQNAALCDRLLLSQPGTPKKMSDALRAGADAILERAKVLHDGDEASLAFVRDVAVSCCCLCAVLEARPSPVRAALVSSASFLLPALAVVQTALSRLSGAALVNEEVQNARRALASLSGAQLQDVRAVSDDAAVDSILSLFADRGLSREFVAALLHSFSGDVEAAATALLENSIPPSVARQFSSEQPPPRVAYRKPWAAERWERPPDGAAALLDGADEEARAATRAAVAAAERADELAAQEAQDASYRPAPLVADDLLYDDDGYEDDEAVFAAPAADSGTDDEEEEGEREEAAAAAPHAPRLPPDSRGGGGGKTWYILNGRVYAYAREGAEAVIAPDAAAASKVAQARSQTEAAAVHGLGEGGNRAAGGAGAGGGGGGGGGGASQEGQGREGQRRRDPSDGPEGGGEGRGGGGRGHGGRGRAHKEQAGNGHGRRNGAAAKTRALFGGNV